ncbi:hypothetical protein D1Z90_18030 [Motilimonas pumila]|uniref:Uncharacterized protein n=1 Tax=Motilimonas pumila TaxID=2303987 RepID=A0A418YAG2_9GAMM|nr:hypothetical protein D1Z90_18030 [Motilimonas pumila]
MKIKEARSLGLLGGPLTVEFVEIKSRYLWSAACGFSYLSEYRMTKSKTVSTAPFGLRVRVISSTLSVSYVT